MVFVSPPSYLLEETPVDNACPNGIETNADLLGCYHASYYGLMSCNVDKKAARAYIEKEISNGPGNTGSDGR